MSVTKGHKKNIYRGRALAVLAFLAGLAAFACSGDGSGDAETRTPTSSTAPSQPVARTLDLQGTAVLYGADPGDNAGAVASGDFNGDGVLDIAFASAFADGPRNERPDAGEAYVFLGPFRLGDVKDAAAGDQQLTVYGADAGDQLGRGIASGDIDGDGADDLVLGAPFGDGPAGDRPESGEVHVVFGSSQLSDLKRVVDLAEGGESALYGARAGDLTGFALATANLNGDATRDIIIGAFGASGPSGDRATAGAVYARLGAAERPLIIDAADGQQDITVHGAVAADRLGEDVAAGDVNGDGLDDLILPAPFAAGTTGVALAGRTYVIHSPAATAIDLSSASVSSIIYGVDNGDQLGHAVSSADVDGDGLADILLTAVSADGPQNAVDLAGEAILVYGSNLGPEVDVAKGAADALIYGADEQGRLGRSSATGDIDGDGRADLLIGAPGGAGPDESAPAAGELYVLLTPGLAQTIQLPASALVVYGESAGDSFATEVFGSPPVITVRLDDDARADIVVSAAAADGPGDARTDCGEVYLLFPAGR